MVVAMVVVAAVTTTGLPKELKQPVRRLRQQQKINCCATSVVKASKMYKDLVPTENGCTLILLNLENNKPKNETPQHQSRPTAWHLLLLPPRKKHNPTRKQKKLRPIQSTKQ